MSDDMQAIIIEGEPFPWKKLHDEIDATNMWEKSPHRAAAMSDPGICSCPRCHKDYWAEGIRQECPACHAQYPTNWWPMLSWGVQHGRIMADKSHPMHKFHCGPQYKAIQYEQSEVFKWGTLHPDCTLDFTAVFKMTDWIAVWNDGAEYVKEGTVVGGHVVGIVRGEKNTLLHVEDKRHPDGRHSDYCSVRCVEPAGIQVRMGDSVWWQAGKVYWTPRRQRGLENVRDYPLEKVGYSH